MTLDSSCECTESRVSSSHRRRSSRRRRPHGHRSRFQNNHAHSHANAPLSTCASTSYRSDPPSDEEEVEDMSVVNPDETAYLSSVSNLIGHLPQPDIVQSTMNEGYCHHLQQMADLSNQQRFHEQSMPFFGQDEHRTHDETNSMPTSSIEKSLLFQ